MKPKKRIIKKWYLKHFKTKNERYQDFCIKKLYMYFPETEKWAVNMKPDGFTPINWYKLIKKLSK